MNKKTIFVYFTLMITTLVAISVFLYKMKEKEKSRVVGDMNSRNPNNNGYKEISFPTPNFDKDRENDVIGVVLHHTAEPTIEKSLAILSSPAKKVGTHVVIDIDGTRYIMADPDVATYHAGYSILNGREGCNYCTIGIEFQGNTLVSPLTNDQIASGIEYLLPIIDKYKIPLDNVVTHEMVRNAYKKKYPHKRCSGKVDITQYEYLRFMRELTRSLTGEN